MPRRWLHPCTSGLPVSMIRWTDSRPSSDKPEKKSFLWGPEDAFKAWKNKSVSWLELRGGSCIASNVCKYYSWKCWKHMPNKSGKSRLTLSRQKRFLGGNRYIFSQRKKRLRGDVQATDDMEAEREFHMTTLLKRTSLVAFIFTALLSTL